MYPAHLEKTGCCASSMCVGSLSFMELWLDCASWPTTHSLSQLQLASTAFSSVSPHFHTDAHLPTHAGIDIFTCVCTHILTHKPDTGRVTNLHTHFFILSILRRHHTGLSNSRVSDIYEMHSICNQPEHPRVTLWDIWEPFTTCVCVFVCVLA